LLAADGTTALPAVLFNSEVLENGFLAAPPAPPNWLPGTRLRLRGPLGRGFSIPEGVRRIALVAMEDTTARMLPLVSLSIRRDIAVAVFTDHPQAALPSLVEINPLSALPGELAWADYLMIDVHMDQLPHLHATLGLSADRLPPCPGQALVLAPMPCAGVADCGVCALPAQRGWKLLCKEGPVVDLSSLLGGLPAS
jgi:dihydroorotate dehydrogenase electron transfer subunit